MINSKKPEYTKINSKTTYLNFFNRLFWKIVRTLKYKHAYFFDTNMIIDRKDNLDNRINHFFSLNKAYLISNITEKEVNEKLKNSIYTMIFNYKVKVLCFNDLRKDNPNLCPVYYNYFSNMYNPANITR